MKKTALLTGTLFIGGGVSTLTADAPRACMVSVSMVNNSRQVYGPVNTECCPVPPFCHTAPWGNWGVASPNGGLIDGHQFDGWKDTGGWRQWNSCTNDYTGCSFLNGCTYQYSTEGENSYGGVTLVFARGCPSDTNGDSLCDEGGCKSLTSITVSAGYMTLYELDTGGGHDLVQTLYYPGSLSVSLSCDTGYCWPSPAYSSWVSPSSYDPPSPAIAYAEIAAKVTWAGFNDPDGLCWEECAY